MDELFEAMTLIQTNRMERAADPVWQGILDEGDHRVSGRAGTISPADIELLNFVETADEAWEQIKDFYKL